MYIKNIKDFPPEELFKTNRIVADWLLAHKIPILSIVGKEYIFHVTAELEILLETKLPWYMRPLLKIPKCFR